MKAVRVNGWGQPVQVEDIPVPEIGNDEVLVRVHAASINPFDAAVHAGYLQGLFSLPLTLGTDFAGEVVKAGSQIHHVQPGDAVYGMTPMHPGSFAEYLVAKANEVTHKPKTLNFIQAAGVPLPALAAYQSLFDLGGAQKGERVLIIGAGGSVGSCAIQLAKELGMEVFAVANPAREPLVRELGADQFVNAQAERFEDVVGEVDLALDFVGGEYLARSYGVLRKGGRFVTSMVVQPPQEEAERLGIRSVGLGTQPKADQLEDIAARIDSNRLRTFINCTFPLEQAQQAMEYRMTKAEPGKVVLTVL